MTFTFLYDDFLYANQICKDLPLGSPELWHKCCRIRLCMRFLSRSGSAPMRQVLSDFHAPFFHIGNISGTERNKKKKNKHLFPHYKWHYIKTETIGKKKKNTKEKKETQNKKIRKKTTIMQSKHIQSKNKINWQTIWNTIAVNCYRMLLGLLSNLVI